MDNYYSKYLKYKSKYFELKGGSLEEISKLRAENKTLEQIIAAGHTNIDLLKRAGYNAMDFKRAGVPLRFLVSIKMPNGFDRNYFELHELLWGGYRPADFKEARLSRDDFDAWSQLELDKAGINEDISDDDLFNYEQKIKPFLPSLQQLMISREENIKKIKDEVKKGSPLRDLIPNYKISELMKAGFTASEFTLLKVPASKLVGFISLRDLMIANYTPKQLKEAGVSLTEMVNERNKALAEKSLNPHNPPIILMVRDLIDAGFTDDELKRNYFSDEDIKRGKEDLEMFKSLKR